MHVFMWETAKGTSEVIQTTQEYVAVSAQFLNICPWQNPMWLGIKSWTSKPILKLFMELLVAYLTKATDTIICPDLPTELKELIGG